jgi:translocation and assembly module TamB
LYDASRRDAPSLDDDVTVRRPGDEEPAVGEEAAVRRNFALKLELDLGERLRVRGRGLDTGLRGELKLSTPGGRLAINGSVRTEQGTYAAYGQKLVIERGILSFAGPPEEPRLDILALRPNIDLRVGVAVSGTALAPRVRLFSDPDGLGRNDTALLQRAAVALLAGEGTAPTDQLMSRLGIDDLSLRQGDSDVRETVIILGKQLSRRWYLGYERGVNATTGTWQLTYRVAQRFTLRAQSGLENSLDAIWTWRFQETPADAAMRKSTVTPRQPAVP